MADNVNITAGSGTIIAADDIGGGVLVQRVKAVLGADGIGVDPSAGSGVNGTGVQRVTIATDDVAIAQLHTDLTAANTQLPTVLGNQAAAASLGVALSTEDIARVGIITESAPASDTASSGLNGRLQRIAQNITTWIGKLTATANADTNRLPVSLDIASPVTGTAASAVVLSNMPFAVGKGAQSITVDITAISTATANFEWSTDGVVAYKPAIGWLTTNSGSSGSVTTATATGTWVFPVLGTHFQVRQSGAGSITATVTPTSSPAPKSITTVTVASNNQLPVLGAANHAAAIVGAPVRIGARGRNFGLPYTAITADQTADIVTNLIGHLKVTKEYSFSNLKANATTTIKSGAGVLHSISINTKGITNTITVYDNTAGSGTTIATIDTTLGQDTLLYDAVFATGLTVVIAGGTAADATFTYN